MRGNEKVDMMIIFSPDLSHMSHKHNPNDLGIWARLDCGKLSKRLNETWSF